MTDSYSLDPEEVLAASRVVHTKYTKKSAPRAD